MTNRIQPIIRDGLHTKEVLNLLEQEIRSEDAIQAILDNATEIIKNSVDPQAGPPAEHSDGLLYGMIQSGKTSVITVAAAIAVDNGFDFVLILTSNIDVLYDQTLERISKALRGLKVLGKHDWHNLERFKRTISNKPFAIVSSKNVNILKDLFETFKKARASNLSALIIDDEADQASLNTYTFKDTEEISRTNQMINNLRDLFKVNTYLQVTATPQALFLQERGHPYRPSFTILSNPGPGYVGGDLFFGHESEKFLKYVELDEVELLHATHQPTPTGVMPNGLKKALYTFFVGATSEIILHPNSGYSFLCHVSHTNVDHEYIYDLFDRFIMETKDCLQNNIEKTIRDFTEAYDDLLTTQPGLPDLKIILEKIKFYLPSTRIKKINCQTDEEIKLESIYNLFIGGNKLGRGVTIKNLIVSYYGRNPRKPNSDTVLQHARMYGYREKNLGVTRLFLPAKMSDHFKLIHQMETALRELIKKDPKGQFELLYISAPLQATRRNVLNPNALGVYVAGGSINPSYPLRTDEINANRKWLDNKLEKFGNDTDGAVIDFDFLYSLIEKCDPDPNSDIELWNLNLIKSALDTLKTLRIGKAYLVVRRGRDLKTHRGEAQGIISGGEDELAPKDAPTLFMYRQNANDKGENEVWWPQLRFPDGNYVLSFSLNR